MKFRIISLPPFKAATSGVDKDFDFSSEGILGKFDAYFSTIVPSDRDSFMLWGTLLHHLRLLKYKAGYKWKLSFLLN